MEVIDPQPQNACLYIWKQMFGDTKAPELGTRHLKHGTTASGDRISADIEYGILGGKKQITISLANGQFWRTYEDGQCESGKTRGLDPNFNTGLNKTHDEDEVILALYNYPPEIALPEIVLEKGKAFHGRILKLFGCSSETIARIMTTAEESYRKRFNLGKSSKRPAGES